jgi:hypothetical protein
MHHETFTPLLRGVPEFATRTLLHLYNLHATRGRLSGGQLDVDSSMSGPHHYFGALDPTQTHTISFETASGLPIFSSHQSPAIVPQFNAAVGKQQVLCLEDHEWTPGARISKETLDKYNIRAIDEQESYVLNDDHLNPVFQKKGAHRSEDSLFSYPGVLELEHEDLGLPLIEDPYNYDLSSFRVQVVPNDTPFAFNQGHIACYSHAQHTLRVITYLYGPRYVEDYLMTGSGLFIERHEFIQSITPMNTECGGYVMIGREGALSANGQRVRL